MKTLVITTGLLLLCSPAIAQWSQYREVEWLILPRATTSMQFDVLPPVTGRKEEMVLYVDPDTISICHKDSVTHVSARALFQAIIRAQGTRKEKRQ